VQCSELPGYYNIVIRQYWRLTGHFGPRLRSERAYTYLVRCVRIETAPMNCAGKVGVILEDSVDVLQA
jgi:hypothetical protein